MDQATLMVAVEAVFDQLKALHRAAKRGDESAEYVMGRHDDLGAALLTLINAMPDAGAAAVQRARLQRALDYGAAQYHDRVAAARIEQPRLRRRE